MTDRKSCVRCHRQIDDSARICPYCNWDQSDAPLPPDEADVAPAWVPTEDRWRNKILGTVAFAALLIIAFVIGAFVHNFNRTEAKAAEKQASNRAVETTPTPPQNITLVPVTGSETTEPFTPPPLTSAPGAVGGAGPNDTTALPSDAYAAAAARARAAQQSQQQQATTSDPRALTGAPYQEAPQPMQQEQSEPAMASSGGTPDQVPSTAPEVPKGTPVRTSAFPQSKPLPQLSFDRDMTARLTVTVGPDGHVTDIDVNQAVPRMPEIISAVQRWRFKPATENGTPVTARVAVDITFHGNG